MDKPTPKQKPLKKFMHRIISDSLTSPVCVGEVTIAMNVFERLKHQKVDTFKVFMTELQKK